MMSSVGSLDLSSLAPIFVSRTHLSDQELHELEEGLEASHATLTYNIIEASIILTSASRKPRILFDLRAHGLHLVEVLPDITKNDLEEEHKDREATIDSVTVAATDPVIIDDSSTASEREHIAEPARKRRKISPATLPEQQPVDIVRVVSLKWYADALKAGRLLSLDDYTVFQGRRAEDEPATKITAPSERTTTANSAGFVRPPDPELIARAKADAKHISTSTARTFQRRTGQVTAPASASTAAWAAGQAKPQYAHLLHATTSEEDHGYSDDLPEPPEWVLQGTKYACQRSTLPDSPNEDFVAQLRKIKLARLLTSDEIGVRAYSTSIAALLACSHKFVSPKEIMRLPGCDAKIANLYVEWANTGKLKAVEDSDADHDLTILRLFYDIWGVGALTAREFYYEHGWQDLDDLVEYNWQGLSRIQQIGVKFYDEFLEKIPRDEVELIGKVIHRHAVKVRDADIQSMIVGGYRRGKAQSGDVDVIVSHPDESKTLNIIADIVASLEGEGWVTHTLLLSLNSTHRDQQTLPFRSGNMHGGHGFDNLDKAFVVWQDPSWPTKAADIAADAKAKNKNIHRRVDIIIAPWRTVGCAVLGWSGGTTFQRDIRRYVKHKFGWKFDSSGVRSRSNGDVLDLEGFDRYSGKLGHGRAKTMLEAEQRVFEGLELKYKQPGERCTD